MRVRRHCSDERADTPDIKKKVEQQYQLRNQIDELEQKLLNSPELKSLRKREASLLNEIDAYRDSTIPVINAQIDKAQAKLALHGLTPTVIAMVEDLLQKYPELL